MCSPGVADGDHRLAHPLLLVGLLVGHVHAERVAVVGDGHVEVRDGDAHVVDGGEQVLGQVRGAVMAAMVAGVGGGGL